MNAEMTMPGGNDDGRAPRIHKTLGKSDPLRGRPRWWMPPAFFIGQ
jgi:hypothetical protein